MDTERLVTMANQIGGFFSHEEAARAVERTADHLRKYWDPRMRAAIVAHLQAGGAGLEATARSAVTLLPKSR
jgi:formate dehydrogenase subunit delta